jgi:hypothetical protein
MGQWYAVDEMHCGCQDATINRGFVAQVARRKPVETCDTLEVQRGDLVSM